LSHNYHGAEETGIIDEEALREVIMLHPHGCHAVSTFGTTLLIRTIVEQYHKTRLDEETPLVW
jgi:hypothetical protein